MSSPTKENWNDFWSKNIDSSFTNISHSKIKIMSILDSHVTNNMFVLDAGCGSGFFSNYFIKRKCNTYTLDYSKEALAIAMKNTNSLSKNYICADLLNFTDLCKYTNFFDIIFTDGLLEHFSSKDQNTIIFNFKKMLKKNGKLITFVPNLFSPWQIIRPFFMPGIKEKPFTLNKLEKLHKNFSICERGGINVFPVMWSPDFLLGKLFGMLLYVIAKK